MTKTRSDDDRRRELKLSNLRHEAAKLAHRIDMMRIELAQLIRGVPRGDPAEARALEQQLWPVIKAWEAKAEEIQAVMQEQRQCR